VGVFLHPVRDEGLDLCVHKIDARPDFNGTRAPIWAGMEGLPALAAPTL
jgi:hypothetical protein